MGAVVMAAQPRPSRVPPSTRNKRNLKNQVSIQNQGSFRLISSNGIPDHTTGRFPNRGNPNSIQEQRYRYRVSAQPQVARNTTPLRLGPFGIAINGLLFDPGAAEFWNRNPGSGWQYEALSGKINLGLDFNNAHVQPNGAYHYHGLPTGLLKKMKFGQEMTLVGYAADGFPIYAQYGYEAPNDPKSPLKKLKPSYQLKQGNRPHGPGGRYDGTFVEDYEYIPRSGQLDECNGREGVTPEYPQGTYHYYLTDTFPFIPRKWKGTPDRSFLLRGPQAGFPPGGPNRPGFPPGKRPPFPPPRPPR